MQDLNILLSAYADGELDEPQVREVEAALATNPSLRQTVDMHRRTTTLLRSACAEGYYAGSVIALARPVRRYPARRLAGWAAAAAVIGMLGFAGGNLWSGASGSARDHLVSEVAEYHEIFARETRHLVEVPASDVDELRSWLGARIGRSIDVPVLTALGLTFAGGRMLVVDGKPVAELMYTRADGPPIALCIADAGGENPWVPASIRMDRKGDLNLASWVTGQHAFVVVGAAGESLVRDVARHSLSQIAG